MYEASYPPRIGSQCHPTLPPRRARFFLHAPRARTHADRATSFPSLISALVLTGPRQHKDTTETINWSSFARRGYVHPFQVQLKSFGKWPAVDVVLGSASRGVRTRFHRWGGSRLGVVNRFSRADENTKKFDCEEG